VTDNQHAKYVEADKRARVLLFAFFGLWIVAESLCRWLAADRIGIKIDENTPLAALRDVTSAFIWYVFLLLFPDPRNLFSVDGDKNRPLRYLPASGDMDAGQNEGANG
jgi:hypothetical protein